MGQKVHPYGIRLGINKTWKSRWFVPAKEYAQTLHEDLRLRKAVYDLPESKGADISDFEIIRQPQSITIVIHTARPGVVIGSKGANIEKIGERLQKMVEKKVVIKIKEIKKPDADAQIIALNIARQLKNRASFRKTVKLAISNALKNGGAQGIKIKLSGRLGGAEMARTLEIKEGRVPLQTFRADLSYGFAEAFTTYGSIGVKVWVFYGELFEKGVKEDAGLLVKKNLEKREGN